MKNAAITIGECPLETRLALTPRDRIEAYRLRYAVYIAEQKKLYPDANNAECILTDDLDDVATTIIASRGEEVIGTMRNNWFDAPAVRSRYDSVTSLEFVSAFNPADISISSRLAVASTERSGEVRSALFNASYRYGILRNTKLNFIFCRPALTRLFRGYGWRLYGQPIHDSSAGLQDRLVLVMDDIEHLMKVNSPFVTLARDLGVRPKQRNHLRELLGLSE
jgi:predicted GNAT family N-acyltransferase